MSDQPSSSSVIRRGFHAPMVPIGELGAEHEVLQTDRCIALHSSSFGSGLLCTG